MTTGEFIDDVAGLLGPEGPVAHALPGPDGYEERAEQLEMGRAVASAVSSARHAIVEAGTGVGKTFAYLVPLLAWSAETGAKVAVSTATIALQEQLVQKDLPLLSSALPFDVSFALVKGRGNYLCTRRLHRALADTGSLFDAGEARAQLESILAWSAQPSGGSRQDLPFHPRPDVWEAVRAEQGNCLGRQCAHYARCHYQRSRRHAHAASLVVLNHHVLVADLALRRSGGSFLPKVDVVVIDEAHDFEAVASEHLGTRVSSLGMQTQLGRLWNPKRRRGLISRRFPPGLRRAVAEVRSDAHHFFGALGHDIGIKDDARTVPIDAAQQLDDPLSPRLFELAAALADAGLAADEMELSLEVAARARGLRATADALESVLAPSDDGGVRWAEPGRHGSLTLCRSPVDVGVPLKQVLWDDHRSVILTSATLSTGRPPTFRFVARALGVEDADRVAIGSPFHYREQAQLRLHAEMPDPAAASAAYEAALVPGIEAALELEPGGALVLFTAYGTLRRAVARLRPVLEAQGRRVLVQGEDVERSVLLQELRKGDAVLFGVASFWQGVDVPGDALRHVIITRLPFEVPTHPLHVARSRRVAEGGGDPFRDLALPQAALRLKQGFGRLIRRSTDEGTVTILDPRIVTKRYGRMLLESLPDCRVHHVPDPDVVA